MLVPAISHDLPFLLKLLDDDSPVVREAVRAKLASMRRELPGYLAKLTEPLNAEQERRLCEILAPLGREELEDSWLAWRWLSSPELQLEDALGQISALLSGWQTRPEELGKKLDALADEAKIFLEANEPRKLADYLFAGRGPEARLHGNSKNYYSADNSNLLWVLAHGRGNPISLACIYMLVGKRLEMKIEGCNFPGHFLARVEMEDNIWLVDCFNRGRFMLATDVARHHPAANPAMEEVIQQPANVNTIIARVLRNLDEAYEREGNMQQRQIVRRLMLRLMED